MFTFSLLILCLNLDALSYGVANGAKNRKFSMPYIFLVCLMSTIMFAIPLGVSKYVFNYFDETVCRWINGIILIVLGIFYMIPKKQRKDKKIKKCNTQKNKCQPENIDSNKEQQTSQTANYSQNNFKINKDTDKSEAINKINSISKQTTSNLNSDLNIQKSQEKNTLSWFSRCFLECLAISVDAIFTAFLSGFAENYYLYSVAFYALTNFLAILLGNRLLYKLSNKINFRLDIFSGLLFVLLGVLKIVGF